MLFVSLILHAGFLKHGAHGLCALEHPGQNRAWIILDRHERNGPAPEIDHLDESTTPDAMTLPDLSRQNDLTFR